MTAGKWERSFWSRLKSKWWVVWWSIKTMSHQVYKFLTSLINWNCMKDEFSKLAYTPCILWGKREIELLSHRPQDGFLYTYIWYTYKFSNLQALQTLPGCLKDTVNSCLVCLCVKSTSVKMRLVIILFNCFLSPSVFAKTHPPKADLEMTLFEK